MSPPTSTPTEQDLAVLPFFAILVLGTRSARRVEPLLRTWEQGQEQHVAAVANATQALERLAACLDAEARIPFWVPTAEAARLAADAASAADQADAPPAALGAADAVAELADAIDPDCRRWKAARAVSRSLEAASRASGEAGAALQEAFQAAVRKDLEKLRLHASVERWTDVTGVPARILDT